MQINFKKILYRSLHVSLTFGASVILGFLSFSGMYALAPVLSLAYLSGALAVAYEGEIYHQGIKGGLKKWFFKKNYLKNLAQEAFIKDLRKQRRLARTNGEEVPKVNPGQTFPEFLKKRNVLFSMAKGMSLLAAVFMGLSTTYLLAEAFAIIPLFAGLSVGLWPVLIAPMALVSGLAYGLLIFNSLTDMINNRTIQKWGHKVKKYFNEVKNDLVELKNRFLHLFTKDKSASLLDSMKENEMQAPNQRAALHLEAWIGVIAAPILFVLSLGLTLCTAGTWWTIVKKTPSIFAAIRNLPPFIMGVINPIITGLSAFIFNIENMGTSLKTVLNAIKGLREGHFFRDTLAEWKETCRTLLKQENFLQFINPFRFIKFLTYKPSLSVCFIGHTASIGVTSDQVPLIPEASAAALASTLEALEDLHFYYEDKKPHSHKKGHSHSHSHSLPEHILNFLFLPISFLSNLWAFSTSQLNTGDKRKLPLKECFGISQPKIEEKAAALCASSTEKMRKQLNQTIQEPALSSIENSKRSEAPQQGINLELAEIRTLPSSLGLFNQAGVKPKSTALTEEKAPLLKNASCS